MATSLTTEIRRLRKVKGDDLTQDKVARRMKMKRSTYAKKEAEGAFTIEEIHELHKIIGGDQGRLIELAQQNQKLQIDDWKEYLIKNAINSNAMQRVILMALSEILAKQRNESVTKVLSELTRAAEGEISAHSMR